MNNINFFAIVNESAGKRFLQHVDKKNINLKGICFDKNSIYKDFFLKYANINHIDFFYYDQIKSINFVNYIKKYSIYCLLNIFGTCIIPNNVINAFKFKCFNFHPGILPTYAGLNPISWSLYDNKKIHGVTVHKITSKVDFGPIISIKKFKITNKDTSISIMNKCVFYGLSLIYDLIFKIQNHKKIIFKKQNKKKFKYHNNSIPNNGFFNQNLSAKKNYLLFKASIFSFDKNVWTYPKILINNKIYFVTSLKIGFNSDALRGSYRINTKSKLMFKVRDKWLILNIIYRNSKYYNDVKKINIFNVKTK